MIAFSAAMRSSLGKKYVMGLTGLVWFGFVIGHLIGNYLLLGGREPFNEYAHFLATFGHHVIYLVEAFLVVVLLWHVVTGFQVAVSDKGRARRRAYAVQADAGGASRKTFASKYMIVTGVLLLLFIVFHIATMKYALWEANPKTYTLDDGMHTEVRDLYQCVVDWFANPLVVGGYVVVMMVLMTHLSHGIWSAFQSLGLLERGYYKQAVFASRAIAVVLALGFIVLPVVILLMQTQFQTPTGGLFS